MGGNLSREIYTNHSTLGHQGVCKYNGKKFENTDPNHSRTLRRLIHRTFNLSGDHKNTKKLVIKSFIAFMTVNLDFNFYCRSSRSDDSGAPPSNFGGFTDLDNNSLCCSDYSCCTCSEYNGTIRNPLFGHSRMSFCER